MTPYMPFVKPSTWHQGRPDETNGVRIFTGQHGVFVAAHDLRQLAEDLHDAADQIEGTDQ